MKYVIKNIPEIRNKLSSMYHARNLFLEHLRVRDKDKMLEDLEMIDRNTCELRTMIVDAPVSTKAHDQSPLGGMMKAKMASFREHGLSFEWLKSLKNAPQTAKGSGLSPLNRILALSNLEIIVRIPPKTNSGRIRNLGAWTNVRNCSEMHPNTGSIRTTTRTQTGTSEKDERG